MAPTPGFEPGPHWWEASALTTAPCTLAPQGGMQLPPRTRIGVLQRPMSILRKRANGIF